MPDLTTITTTNGASVPTPSPIPARPPAPPAWDDLAASRLRELLTQIEAIDELRREATRVHAALLAYGRAVDSLPWSESGQPVRSSRPAQPCAPCGRAFYPPHRKSRYCTVRCGSLATAARFRQQWTAAAGQGEGQETAG